MSLLVGEALAAAASRLGGDRDRVLARIGGGLGVAARVASARLAALPPAEQKQQRARIAVLARAPVPPGLRGVHPTWIEASLARLPERARRAVAAGTDRVATSEARVDVWLARWATAELVPMPELRAEAPRDFGDLPALPSDALAAWLANAGADQLARTVQIAGSRVPPVLAAAFARIAKPPRVGQLGPDAAVVARCRGITFDEHDALERIGARAIAPGFATDPIGRHQLALRLPRELGSAVERELREHAHVPLDQCPTWTALAAH